MAKWTGAFLCLAAPLVAGLTGVVFYASASGLVDIDHSAWLRIACGLVLACLYAGLFCSLGLLVSVLARRSSTALVIALVVWVVWVLLVPTVAPVMASVVVPAPSLRSVENAQEFARWEGRRRHIEIGRSDLGDAEKHRQHEQVTSAEKHHTEAAERDARVRYDRQIALSRLLAQISPSGAYRQAAAELSGTGTDRFQTYRSEYARFKKDFFDFEKMAWSRYENETIQDVDAWLQRETVPGVHLQPSGVTEDLYDAAPDALTLLLYGAVLLLAAHLAFLRQDLTMGA